MENATDIGYLLHKNPANIHQTSLAFGDSHVFYPITEAQKCSMSFLVDVDPITLIRGRKGDASDAYPLQHYVNDRPYVANSFMSVAIAKTFGTALNGSCKRKPELVHHKWSLTIELPCVRVKGGETTIFNFMRPLGYEVECKRLSYDESHPEWGGSPYYCLKLSGVQTIQEALSQKPLAIYM